MLGLEPGVPCFFAVPCPKGVAELGQVMADRGEVF